MPTIHRDGPYRFYFFSNEGVEPPHVHIDRDTSSAKYWLEPVSMAANHGFSASELNRLHRLVAQNRQQFLDAWYEHFGQA